MKLNPIARTIAALVLGLGALFALGGTASANEPGEFTPPYVIQP
ncbi:hypothetical protein SAMN05216553_106182 [Lentzea fradiae]|uniref:Uncharacterized protein n=1 Tax=Lentzea fradiae TaxID=200378 RepID=A0A1G7SCV1_9PSEU|nr:hypothetical protein [Lentzea fradiae]SDG20866.1 hypothetical protein SAMN05216553_106182 [Lentzea fradiae]